MSDFSGHTDPHANKLPIIHGDIGVTELAQRRVLDVCYWHLADIHADEEHVRYWG